MRFSLSLRRRYCASCGAWLPASAGLLQKFCDPTCRGYWNSLRYHIDDQRRAKGKQQTARWVLENPEGQPAQTIRYARRILEGTAGENESSRWLIEGSAAWNVATKAVLNNWPIARLLPRGIQVQIEVSLGHLAPASDGRTGRSDEPLTAEFLRRQYVEANRSPRDIASETGLSSGIVLAALNSHGIQVRDSCVVAHKWRSSRLTKDYLERVTCPHKLYHFLS
jgi:hypothetical protein